MKVPKLPFRPPISGGPGTSSSSPYLSRCYTLGWALCGVSEGGSVSGEGGGEALKSLEGSRKLICGFYVSLVSFHARLLHSSAVPFLALGREETLLVWLCPPAPTYPLSALFLPFPEGVPSPYTAKVRDNAARRPTETTTKRKKMRTGGRSQTTQTRPRLFPSVKAWD